MKQTKKNHSHAKPKSINEIEKKIADAEPEALELTPIDEATIDGEVISGRDSNFASFKEELEYDGYSTIEKYDNDEYNANVEGKEEPLARGLRIEDRPEDDSIAIEENVLDKQGNRSDER